MNKKEKIDSEQIIKALMIFLKLFICETLAKRVVSIILLIAGVPTNRITELTGLCDKSVRTLKKRLESGEVDTLLHVSGGGAKGKLANVEATIIEEINKNEYHSQQQIADMVYDRFGIKVSPVTIGRLLKKTASNV